SYIFPPCFFLQAEDGIRDFHVTGVQTCALPILLDGVVRAGVDGTVGARVALVCASEGAPVNALAAAVAERLRGWGRTLVLSSREIGRASCREGAVVGVAGAGVSKMRTVGGAGVG